MGKSLATLSTSQQCVCDHDKPIESTQVRCGISSIDTCLDMHIVHICGHVCVCVLCYICTMCVLCVVSQLYCVCDVFMCNVFCLYCAGVLKCNCKTQQSYIHTYIPVVHVSHSHQQNIPIMCYCHPIYRNLDHFLLRYSYQRASPLLMPPPGLQGHTLYRLITNFL